MSLYGSWGPGSLMQCLASNLVPSGVTGSFFETPCLINCHLEMDTRNIMPNRQFTFHSNTSIPAHLRAFVHTELLFGVNLKFLAIR
jgi:hypothetical protein